MLNPRTTLQFAAATSWPQSTCLRCIRSFATTRPWLAGHNKWSKTKHIKAVTDKKKMVDRTTFTRLITMYSKMFGDDLKFNPQLVNAISAATKASVPKAIIENAIAMGQGRSATGASLEAMTFEVLMPPNIALIVDVETDSKKRTIQNLKLAIKDNGGVVGSTSFYFSRRGRAVFKANSGGPALSDVLEEAIEHEGVEDVEELPGGGFLVWTQPASLMAVAGVFTKQFGLEILEADIVWAAKEDTKTGIDSSESVQGLDALLSSLRDHSEVKAVYANISQGDISDDEWSVLERNIDA